jgi:hypothetical protein
MKDGGWAKKSSHRRRFRKLAYRIGQVAGQKKSMRACPLAGWVWEGSRLPDKGKSG